MLTNKEILDKNTVLDFQEGCNCIHELILILSMEFLPKKHWEKLRDTLFEVNPAFNQLG